MNRIISYCSTAVATLLILLSFSACSSSSSGEGEDEDDIVSLTISKPTMTFIGIAAPAQSTIVTAKNVKNWSVVPGESWISTQVSSEILTVLVEDNTTGANRSGLIALTSTELEDIVYMEVIQNAATTPTLYVQEETSLAFEADDTESQTVTIVSANISSWSASSFESWISLEQTADDKLTISVDANTEEVARTGSISITAPEYTGRAVVVNVTQSKAEIKMVSIRFSSTTYQVENLDDVSEDSGGLEADPQFAGKIETVSTNFDLYSTGILYDVHRLTNFMGLGEGAYVFIANNQDHIFRLPTVAGFTYRYQNEDCPVYPLYYTEEFYVYYDEYIKWDKESNILDFTKKLAGETGAYLEGYLTLALVYNNQFYLLTDGFAGLKLKIADAPTIANRSTEAKKLSSYTHKLELKGLTIDCNRVIKMNKEEIK